MFVGQVNGWDEGATAPVYTCTLSQEAGEGAIPRYAKRWQSDSANSHFPASRAENDSAWELGSCQKLADLG